MIDNIHDMTDRNYLSCTDGRKHVMISYQWGSQELMKRIRDELKSAGYEVWMDLDNMSKSTSCYLHWH